MEINQDNSKDFNNIFQNFQHSKQEKSEDISKRYSLSPQIQRGRKLLIPKSNSTQKINLVKVIKINNTDSLKKPHKIRRNSKISINSKNSKNSKNNKNNKNSKNSKNTSFNFNTPDLLDEEINLIGQKLTSANGKELRDKQILLDILSDQEKYYISIGQPDKFLEIIRHILRKNQKMDNEILLLKLYFLRFKKFILLLKPLKINIDDMLTKLVNKMKFEKVQKDKCLWKAGEEGDKLYIILKGNISILLPIDAELELTKIEYIKYLIILYIYQEYPLISKIIEMNKLIVKIEDKVLFTMLHIFKFFKFLNNNQKLRKIYSDVFTFLENEEKIKNYITKKFDYSAMDSLCLLEYDKTIIIELYDFYVRTIKKIKRAIHFQYSNIKFSKQLTLINYNKKTMKPSIFRKPLDEEELIALLNLYKNIGKKFKTNEDFYEKISTIYEISPDKISGINVKNYLYRLENDFLLQNIKEDAKTCCCSSSIIFEKTIKIKCFNYSEVSQLNDGNLFGEYALLENSGENPTSIITNEECYFCTILKSIYDSSLKFAQERLHLRFITFFTKGPIFNGISNNYFLSKYSFYIKKNTYNKGDILFNYNSKRQKIFFVIKGEFELSGNMTLEKMTKTINTLGGETKDEYLYLLCKNFPSFNYFYKNINQSLKFCIMKDKGIIGLNDMTIDDINLFDCKCVSVIQSDVYEIENHIFEEMKKNVTIKNNHDKYLQNKKEFIVKVLFEQRNSIIANELIKLKLKIDDRAKKEKNELKLKNKFKNCYLKLTKDVVFSEIKFDVNEFKSKTYNKAKKRKIIKEEEIVINENKNINENDIQNNVIKCKTNDFKKCRFNTPKKENINYKNELSFFSLNKNESKNKEKTLFKKMSMKNPKISDSLNKQFTLNKENVDVPLKDVAIVKTLSYCDKSTMTNQNTFLLNNVNNNNNTKIKSLSGISINNKFDTQFSRIFKKDYKPLITMIPESRIRKKIIPSSINSRKTSHFLLKECQEKYTVKKNIFNSNDFYITNQNIFDSLLNNKSDFNSSNNSNFRSGNSVLSFGSRNNKTIFAYNHKKNNSNSNSLLPSINNTEINLLRSRNNMNTINNNEAGIIDCLCLDNWEKKIQIQKKFFSEL